MIKTPAHLKYKAVNAGYLLATMTEADTELNIMILDACREHPFAVFDDPQIPMGMAPMIAPPGSLIAYPTGPNMLAFNNEQPAENNSPYISYLKEHMLEEDVQLEIMLRRVRTEVTGKSGHINIYACDSRLEIYETFKRLVLQDRSLALQAKSFKSNSELAENVAKIRMLSDSPG